MSVDPKTDERIEAEEDLVIDAQFLLQGIMNDRGISRAELARMTGLSRARLTQLMRPEANPTLRTLASIFHALGERVEIDVRSKALRIQGGGDGSDWSMSAEESCTETMDFSVHFARWLDRPRVSLGTETASNDNPPLEASVMQVA
jgi:DNA-binding phage protein